MQHRKIYLFIICLLTFPLIMAVTCYANPDVKPFFVIIVDNAPSDLELSFVGESEPADDFEPGVYHIRKSEIGKETQFSFHAAFLKANGEYKIRATTGGKTTEYSFDNIKYRNVYTLDLQNNTLTDGKTPLRYIRQVMIYVFLTLLLEGLIFYIFGFRKRKSWIAFVIINLITQGLLHIWLDSPNYFSSFMDGVIIFGISELIVGLVMGEIFVFIFEIIAFAVIVKERSIKRKILYVLIANSFSLVLGLLLFPFIPI